MIMEWHYAHDADITIGEKHISQTAKVLLITLLSILAVTGGVAFYYRGYIYDYIADPNIILTNEVVQLDIDAPFNADEYVINNDGVPYEVVDANLVDTSVNGKKIDKTTKVLSRYEVKYIIKNRARTHNKTLVVEVIDNKPPEIELKKELVLLVRGSETNSFNPKYFIKALKDNYSEEKNIKVEYPTTFDWNETTFQVEYKATDEVGNSTTKVLNVGVMASEEERRLAEEAERKRKEEEAAKNKPTDTPKPTSAPAKPTSAPSKPKATATPKPKPKNTATSTPKPTSAPKDNGGGSTNTPTPKPKDTNTPTPTKKPATPTPKPKAYINGVHNISVPVGTSQGTIMKQLMKGVSGSGQIWLDCSNVNTTVAGSYKVYFESDDGVTKTATVTVTDE